MTKFAGVFSGGIAVVGMSDLRSFLLNTAPYRRHLRISEYGDPEKDVGALKELSAMHFLDKLSDPLLIVHGANDPRVPAGEAIQFYRQMQKRKIDGKLVLFPDEGHGIALRSNRVKYTAYVIEFLKRFQM
jgi:dipeptidyl aminopeptidase/acylaminoacyl peptidase